ncbi:hypothetical protein Mal15_54990 [Stieleria maiorica]|uniref:Uncharacterized protein n=1 Tax=Stieleria maiorica TaxID=2795974 RepID=A0A5B9MJ70_9BACT|nr:hypothetical protein Mal15_54990 [Stieleria maiorica]
MHRPVRGAGRHAGLKHRRGLPMYSIRIATGNSNLPISSQHFRRRFSALKSSGVGLSSSAESTAHPSYRDIKSESQETEVRRHQVGQIRAHPSAAWTTGAGPSQPSLLPRTPDITEHARWTSHFKNLDSRASVHVIVPRSPGSTNRLRSVCRLVPRHVLDWPQTNGTRPQ